MKLLIYYPKILLSEHPKPLFSYDFAANDRFRTYKTSKSESMYIDYFQTPYFAYIPNFSPLYLAFLHQNTSDTFVGTVLHVYLTSQPKISLKFAHFQLTTTLSIVKITSAMSTSTFCFVNIAVYYVITFCVYCRKLVSPQTGWLPAILMQIVLRQKIGNQTYETRQVSSNGSHMWSREIQ